MHMRAALWSIVVEGLIGALLWTAPVGATTISGRSASVRDAAEYL